MWGTTWKYKEGLAIGAGLVLTGILLQAAMGRVEWDSLAAPVNYVALAMFLALLVVMHLLRHKVYLFAWLGTLPSAVTSIAFCAVLTAMMGLIRQQPSSIVEGGFPGFSQMLSQWAFVLVYIWMMVSLGMAILRVCIPLKVSRIPFLLNHLGLFVALICGVLGSADLQRLKMQTRLNTPEWRAMDGKGQLHELPIAVELKQFRIDLYPPKLVLVDNVTGETLSEPLLLEEGVTEAVLGDWNVSVKSVLTDAAPVFSGDTVRYVPFHSTGGCAAVLVKACRASELAEYEEDASSGATPLAVPYIEDWVSCGSYAFPYKVVRLDSIASLVMPDPEPRRYSSAVNIYTESGKSLTDTIEVNHPARVDGWKIYQLSYDDEMGRWSETSVFEIVRDSWMPAVYVGIWMMIAGAVCMFVQFGRKKEDMQTEGTSESVSKSISEGTSEDVSKSISEGITERKEELL